MSGPPIHCRDLERSFGSRRALAGVSLDVAPGEIVGLVGPNGSGKTTLLKILSGFLRPDAGEARCFGYAPFTEQTRLMQRARFAFAPPALFEALTAREHLFFLTRLRTPAMGRIAPRDVEQALDIVGLLERADDRVDAFSFGMRQRLVLAQALLPTPELLVLDEPTDGLDPEAILELREVLRELRAEHGTAILLSSHLLVEIEQLVDRMLVLSEGLAVFDGTPRELTAPLHRLRIGVDQPERARLALAEHGLAVVLTADNELELAADALQLEEARALLAKHGVRLDSFHRHRPGLEEALLGRLRSTRRPA